jgi:hypothetical protein
MKTLIYDMKGLADLANKLMTQGDKALARVRSVVDEIQARRVKADPGSPDFAEFDRLRRATFRDLSRLECSIRELVGDDGLLPGLAGPLLDNYLQALFASGRPIKEWVRGIEDRAMRKAVNHRFRQWRERHILAAIAAGAVRWDVPRGGDPFGVGIDERIVEFPLAFQVADFQQPGRILDAGAAMNLSYIRQAIGTPAASVIHFTQSGDKELCRFQGDRYSYLFGDLRRTDFRDDAFDRILCISTLEHVGMDNSRYGGEQEWDSKGVGASVSLPAGDGSHLDAVVEMLRILAPGGQLVITVPFGQARTHGWYQVFDQEGVAQILDVCLGHDILEKHYFYRQGWCEGGAVPAADLAMVGTDVTGLWAVRVTKSGERR